MKNKKMSQSFEEVRTENFKDEKESKSRRSQN